MATFRGVAVLSLLVLLISCSEDDPWSDPSEPTGQTATTSTTPSPTGPVEPKPPEPTSEPTKASAIAFVKYYFKVADYAQATAESDTLRSLASKNCAFCEGTTDYLDKLRVKGGVVKSKSFQARVISAQVGETGDIDIALVVVKLAAPKSVEFYGVADPRNRRFPGGHRTYTFMLEWAPSLMTWLIQEVEKS